MTKEYRKNQLLLHPNGQRPLTAKEAEAAAKARWAELEADVVRAKHGLTLRKDFNPNDLIESFIDHQRSQSSRPDAEEQSIRRAFLDLGLCSRFKECENLSMVYGAFAFGIADDLLKSASTLTSTRRFRNPANWVRTRLLVLRRMIRWAEERLEMPVTSNGISPCLNDFAAPCRSWDFYFTLEEAAAIERILKRGIVTTRDPYLTMMMWFLMYTGARRSEIMCIRVRDVLPEGTTRHPKGTLRVWNSKLAHLKVGRRIPGMRESILFPKLRKAVEHFVKAMNLKPDDFLCMSPSRVKKLRETGVDVRSLRSVHRAVANASCTSLYRYIKNLCVEAGVEAGDDNRHVCHIWRHTYVATRGLMVHEGGNPVTLSDLQGEIGHILNSETTRNVYEKAAQHPLPDRFDVLDWRQMAHSALKRQRENAQRPRRARANLPAMR